MENVIKKVGWMMVFCLIILCLGVRSPEVLGAEITLRFAGNLPIGHHNTRGQEFYSKLIMERTHNRVKVEVFPAGQLFSDKDLMKALPSGAVDMALTHPSWWTGINPLELLLDLPFVYDDLSHYHRVLDTKAGEILKQEMEEKIGVKFLYWCDYETIEISSRVPLKTLEDFKGKRIRAPGEMTGEAIRALGASPTALGGGEVYMAFQRGIIEGTTTGVTSIWERKYIEVAKYLIVAHLSYSTFPVRINKKKWDGLPKDVQKIMLEAAIEAQEWGRKEAQKMAKETLETLTHKGLDVYKPPESEMKKWREASKPCVELFLKRAGEKGKVLLELVDKVR